jgi:serine phosphatase RsbU (regulator of sigma subunit)
MKLRFYVNRLMLLFALFPTVSLTQSYLEDSLSSQILITSDPHKKILLLGDLCSEFEYSNSKKSIEIAKQAFTIAKQDAKQDINYCTNLLGLCFINSEQYDSALYYLQITFDRAFEKKDTSFMSKAINNIGLVYLNLGQYEKGLSKIKESGKLDYAFGDRRGAAISFMNVGSIQIQLDEFKAGRSNLMTAQEIFQSIGDKENEATVYLNLGALEVSDGNINQGKTYFFRAISIQEEQHDLDGVARSYSNLAYSFRQQAKYKIALIYDLKSLEYADLLNSSSAKEAAYKGLAETYEGMTDYKSALDNYRIYMAWSDTIQNQDNLKVIIEMQEKYNSVQTTKENEILQQQNKIETLQNKENKAKLGQSRIIIFSSILGLLFVIGFAAVLFNRNVIKQKAYLELQNANEIIQEKNNDITASIEYASKIQEALLPTKENPELFTDSFFILMPKDIVSGDFLWYSQNEKSVVFSAADCTGHGVPGAFMSMIGNTFLHQIVNENKEYQPSKILDLLREKVILALNQQGEDKARKDGMDMALCCLNKETLELQYAGANNPLYLVHKGEMKEIKPDKQPVGYMPERPEKFQNHSLQLEKGDAVYIFSDGYADQFGGPKGKKFKYKQLRELLLAIHQKPMLYQKQELITVFNDWKGGLEQIDDVCVVGVRI